jgi:O-antigen/teichoic acid export membrane protein
LVWAHLGLLNAWQDLGTTSYGLLQGKADNYKTLNNIFSLRLLLSVAVAFGTILASFLFKYDFSVSLVIICFAGLFAFSALSGFYLVLNSLNKTLYKSSALSVVFNVFLIAVNISLLLWTKDIYLLLKITAFSYLGFAFVLLFLIRQTFPQLKFSLNKTILKKVIQRSAIFSLISFLASLYFKMDFIILNHFHGSKALGVYSAGYKFFEVPLLMVANYNFSSLPTFKRLYKENFELYKQKIAKDSLFLLLLATLVILGTLGVGQFVIGTIFSQKYLAAVPVLYILIFTLPFILLSSVFLNALYAQRKEKYVLALFSCVLLFNLISNYLFIPKYGYLGAAKITVLTELFGSIIFGAYLLYNLRKPHVKNRN